MWHVGRVCAAFAASAPAGARVGDCCRATCARSFIGIGIGIGIAIPSRGSERCGGGGGGGGGFVSVSTEEDDHCETPAHAYHDIEPMLAQVAALLGKEKAGLRIYDPFYCQGAVVRHLSALGYHSVYNRCEDFYGKVAAGTVPEYDVLVTNPPYSHDHIERLLRYCATCKRPWFVLVPNFVVRVGSVGGGAATGAGQAIS